MNNMLEKSKVSYDTTLLQLKFIMKGFRQEIIINCTATESMDFVDFLNENRHKKLTRKERESMDYKFYSFKDWKKKESVTINLNDVKSFRIPFFKDVDDDFIKLHILTC